MAKAKRVVGGSSKITNLKLSSGLITVFCLLVALTPLISPYAQLLGNSINVVTAHPWMSMASWQQVTMSAFIGYCLFRRHKLIIHLSPISLLVLLLVGWLFLSTLWAHNKFESIVHICYWLTALFGYWVVICWLDKRHWQLLLILLFSSGVMAAVLGIVQYLFNFSAVVQAVPPASFFGNKNMGSHYALLTFPLGIGLFWASKSALQHWFYALGSTLIVVYIVYANARAAWMATIIAISFSVISLTILVYKGRDFGFSTSRWQSCLVAVLLLLALIHFNREGFNPNTIVGVTNAITSIAEQATDNFDKSNVRLIKWRNAWDLYTDNWLVGIGLRNWLIEYPVYHQRYGFDVGVRLNSQSDHTHNDYIQLIVEGGTVALVLFISLVWLVFRHLLCYFKALEVKTSQDTQPILLIGIIGCLVAIGIDALFSFPLQLPHTMFLFLLYIGMIASIEKPIKSVELKPAGLKPLGIGFGLFSLFSIILYNQWFNAEIWFRKANFYIQTNRHQEALIAADQAYNYNPYKYDMLKYRAVTYKKLNHPQTEQMILAVLASYPNNLNSLNRAVNFYMSQQRSADALQFAIKNRDLAPGSSYVYQNLAAVYQALGRTDKVIENISKLLAIDPNHANAKSYRQLLSQYESSK